MQLNGKTIKMVKVTLVTAKAEETTHVAISTVTTLNTPMGRTTSKAKLSNNIKCSNKCNNKINMQVLQPMDSQVNSIPMHQDHTICMEQLNKLHIQWLDTKCMPTPCLTTIKWLSRLMHTILPMDSMLMHLLCRLLQLLLVIKCRSLILVCLEPVLRVLLLGSKVRELLPLVQAKLPPILINLKRHRKHSIFNNNKWQLAFQEPSLLLSFLSHRLLVL